jgi:uncharacterized protein YbaP (TraB family)
MRGTLIPKTFPALMSDYYVGYFSVTDKAEGLWYTIRDNQEKIVGYLFGTIHTPINNFGEFDPNLTSRSFNYEPKWKRAFNECDTIAVEMSVDDLAQAVFQRLDQNSCDDFANSCLNNPFIEKMYRDRNRSMKGIYSQINPDTLKCDQYLEQQGYAQGKKVVSLEEIK